MAIKIYYMRDNHTFRRLSTDIEVATQEVLEEFDSGYTMGMLCSDKKEIRSINVGGSKGIKGFLSAMRTWYKEFSGLEECWLNTTRQCCCSCTYQLIDMGHPHTNGTTISTPRGFICAPSPEEWAYGENGRPVAHSEWTEHSCGCELYRLRTKTGPEQ
jgi:hypothetical protein